MWAAYVQRNPFGDEWEQTATITCNIANLFAKPKLRPWHIIPGYKERELRRRRLLRDNMESQRDG